MARTTKARGRNLFALDQGSIESTLIEANATLLRERDNLLKAFEKLPVRLETVVEIERTQEFARKLEDLLSEARRARLSDGKPFSEASKVVKDFFARIEGPVRAMLDDIVDRVTSAALRQRRLEEEEALHDSEEEAPSDAPLPSAAIRGRDGTPVVARTESSSSHIQMEWVVAEFDRQVLNLEELRPFFTDTALLSACRKHLEVNGPHRLKGVTYEQVAQI